mmetsp:Transcript_11367/g.18841  ORF Transcript_11367/g.18841 Transcript_11367/m.18841 type:complete len:92 (-) Transcript_11367:826-1101(-)
MCRCSADWRGIGEVNNDVGRTLDTLTIRSDNQIDSDISLGASVASCRRAQDASKFTDGFCALLGLDDIVGSNDDVYVWRLLNSVGYRKQSQ